MYVCVWKPTNRDKARKARRNLFWCPVCDRAIISEGERCPYCKKRIRPYRAKKDCCRE